MDLIYVGLVSLDNMDPTTKQCLTKQGDAGMLKVIKYDKDWKMV